MSWIVGFHQNFTTDLSDILAHYEYESGPKLVDEFYQEFRATIHTVQENPAFFPRYRAEIRRANLKRFPYHFLYEIQLTSVWVFVLRHHRRNPDYGITRLL